MQSQEINLSLSIEEVNGVIQVLGELPTKSGAFTLLMKIKEQAESQLKQTEAATE